mmetsp:Transcript_42885/g.102634  ORF Transcript_42885/g.102634 Transcript_42885/m.102634 type:complete len:105 (+) Transcript_42885:150-464(+)
MLLQLRSTRGLPCNCDELTSLWNHGRDDAPSGDLHDSVKTAEAVCLALRDSPSMQKYRPCRGRQCAKCVFVPVRRMSARTAFLTAGYGTCSLVLADSRVLPDHC